MSPSWRQIKFYLGGFVIAALCLIAVGTQRRDTQHVAALALSNRQIVRSIQAQRYSDCVATNLRHAGQVTDLLLSASTENAADVALILSVIPAPADCSAVIGS